MYCYTVSFKTLMKAKKILKAEVVHASKQIKEETAAVCTGNLFRLEKASFFKIKIKSVSTSVSDASSSTRMRPSKRRSWKMSLPCRLIVIYIIIVPVYILLNSIASSKEI